MKTKNQKIKNIPQSLALFVNGRKGTSGEQKSSLQGVGFSGSFNSSPDTGRLGVVFSVPPQGGGTFCEAKGGGVSGAGRKAFTLVELIIVITILAILATLAFMSFQGYAKQSRDSNRLATMKSIEKGLTIFQTKSGVYPQTESGVLITASGTTIGNQGFVGDGVVRGINMNQIPLDPVDNARYVYSTNEPKTKYQLMTFMEGENNLVSFLPQSFASDLTDRFPLTIGDSLGIVLNQDNSLPTNTVNASSGSTNYKVVFGKNNEVIGSGNILSAIQAQRGDKTLASLDESLVGYWDMETTIQSGGTLLLKDWSKYGNHGTCYNSGSIVDCGGNNGGPQFVDGNGKTGKAMSFDGGDDFILSTNNSTFSGGTYFIKLKNSNYNGGVLSYYFNDFHRLRLYMDNLRTFVFSNVNGYPPYVDFGNDTQATINKNHVFISKIDFSSNKYSIFFDGKIVNNIGSLSGVGIYGKYIITIGALFDYDSPGHHCYNFFSGLIDEVRIYNRALSDSEVQALYNATK